MAQPTPNAVSSRPSLIRQRAFGRTKNGQDVTCYIVENGSGMSLEILDYGAIIRCLNVRHRDGRTIDSVLGYDDLASYESDRAYMGCVIGRYANRIRNGTFILDGETFHLSKNDGIHHLHGGGSDFGRVMWRARPFETGVTVGVVMEHRSSDGEDGYPGNLDVRVTYAVSSSNVLSVEYLATSDRATPVNLTQHSYFNLSGEGSGDVLDHELVIDADSFAEIDRDLIPTGSLISVKETPLDFRNPVKIGEHIQDNNEQLRIAGGYDHNFVLAFDSRALSHAARVFAPQSGVAMDVFTTEPGMQFYSGNFLDGIAEGKRDHRYQRHEGFCLETQHFPDSPNQPNFPSTILRPGGELRSRTEYRFSTQ